MEREVQPIRFSVPAKAIAVAIIVALTILLLRSVTHILAPFIAAIITAYLFNPLVSLLQQRTRFGRAFWIVVLYLIFFALLYALFIWLWPRITTQYRGFASWVPSVVSEIALFFETRQTLDLPGGLIVDLAPIEEQVISVVTEFGRTLSGTVPKLVFSALETVIFMLVYLIITFYLLLQAGELRDWAVRLIPSPYREEISSLGSQIDRALAAFIRGQLLLIIIMAVLLYIPLSILQVPYALVIAIISGVLELLPIIGPWSAAGIAMVVALFQVTVPFGLSNGWLAVLIGVIYFTLRQIEDHFIIPNVMGPLLRLHPGMVIFAILAGGAIGGAFGLFIAVPVAAVCRILLRYVYSKLVDGLEPPPPPPTVSTSGQSQSVEEAPPPPQLVTPQPQASQNQ